MSDTEMPQHLTTTQTGPPTPPRGSNGLATAGFVVGLIGFLLAWIPVVNIVGIILGILGAVFAAIGLAKSKRAGSGKGLSIAGLILGVLAVVIAIIVNAAFVDAVDEAVDELTETTVEVPAGSGDTSADEATDSDAKDDADGKAGATRANPAPIGSAITGDDWTVTINSVTTVTQDSFDQKPDAGHTLLAVNMTATYNGDDEQGDSVWATVKFVSADGTSIDSTDAFFVAENEFDSLKTLYSGGSVTGDRLLQVPADGWEKGVLAVSPGMFSDDTFVAVK